MSSIRCVHEIYSSSKYLDQTISFSQKRSTATYLPAQNHQDSEIIEPISEHNSVAVV
ncbi:predicted protein [Botrytis cinerea T4]|uniref:Uncharacterized protein n=1 Tax=Botryotinia fuckeliana (strain T4) TaxID=999810 RepID=G2YG24_BOTF4|nr:predicted protein [Botrytis cinerea T4]